MKKKKFKVLGIILCTMLFLSLNLKVYAQEQIGSITVAIPEQEEDKKELVNNITFYVTKVASLQDGAYVLLPEYQDTKLNFNKITKASELEAAAQTLAKIAKKDSSKNTNENGACRFDNLLPGIYLVQSETTKNYKEITPAIVSLPVWEENAFNYEVSVVPKMELKKIGRIVAGAYKLPPYEDLKTDGTPRTGDNTPISLYIIAVTLSGLTLIGYKVRFKKKKRGVGHE